MANAKFKEVKTISEAHAKQAQMGKLPTDSLSRLGMLVQKSTVEKTIKEYLENAQKAKHLSGGYHLHCSPSEPNNEDVLANQLHIFVKDSYIYYKYKDDTKKIVSGYIYPSVVANSHEHKIAFDKIQNKLNTNAPLTSTEVKKVFSCYFSSLPQNNHPLLQTMDEYIVSMQRKINGEHVNEDMANDKITFTKVLQTFIEDPNENNWHAVRNAMHANPRYGFSWTGMSQADYFLTVIKIQYAEDIKKFDARYGHSNEAKTSWGRFVYNLGFVAYIPSFFLLPYKLLKFVYREVVRELYQEKLDSIEIDISQIKESALFKSNFKKQAENIHSHLKTYLGEDETKMTEDLLEHIEEINKSIDALNPKYFQDNEEEALAAKIQKGLKKLANNINTLIPRPIPLRNSLQMS